MIEETLRNSLLAETAVSTRVGARVYPITFPQGAAFPLVTYQRIAGASARPHSGPIGLGSGRFQFDCWGRSYDEMIALAEAVRATLAAAGHEIVNILDFPEPAVKLWRRMVEIVARHTEGIAA